MVRAKENLKFSHGGPSPRQTPGTKPLRQGRQWAWGLTRRRAIKLGPVAEFFWLNIVFNNQLGASMVEFWNMFLKVLYRFYDIDTLVLIT